MRKYNRAAAYEKPHQNPVLMRKYKSAAANEEVIEAHQNPVLMRKYKSAAATTVAKTTSAAA